MPIKMIVTDMDGTFLNDAHTYNHARFAQALHLMQKRGVKFVLASGSSYPRLVREFAGYEAQLDFISQNGSVSHAGTSLTNVVPISHPDIDHIIRSVHKSFPAEHISELIVAGVDTAYVDQSMSPASLADTKIFYEQVEVVPDLTQLTTLRPHEAFTKVAVRYTDPVSPTQFNRIMDGQLPNHLLMETSGFNTELIGQAGATKANAIAQLLARDQIAPDEIATFGDNENDLGMLAMTPFSYAMANAAPLIKMQAANVTEFDNNHDGVLKEIIKLLK